jgi:hypothetical protein
MITLKQKFDYYLSFSGFPVWLLGLEGAIVARLCFCQHANLDELISRVTSVCGAQLASVATFLCHRIGIEKLVFGTTPALTATGEHSARLLVSGSLDFIRTTFITTHDWSLPTLAILDLHFSSRLHQGRPSGVVCAARSDVKWLRVRHTTVGGPTGYCVLVGYRHCTLEPQLSMLRRDIQSIVDFGIRPTSCPNPLSDSSDTGHEFYLITDKLQVGHLLSDIILRVRLGISSVVRAGACQGSWPTTKHGTPFNITYGDHFTTSSTNLRLIITWL